MRFYLDSSALAKRYLAEKGTEVMDRLFEQCWMGRHSLGYSIWNIGEYLGVIDRRRNKGQISEQEFQSVLRNFVEETASLLEVGRITVHPMLSEVLAGSWPTILSENIYEADAVQLATSVSEGCEAFVTADRKLSSVARQMGIKAYDIESAVDRVSIAELIGWNGVVTTR